MTKQETIDHNGQVLIAQTGVLDEIPSNHSLSGDSLRAQPDHETIEADLLPLLRSKQLDRDPYIRFVVQWCRAKIQTNLPHTDQASVNDRDHWLLGRSRRCAVVLPDPTISRHHALIGYDVLEGFYVRDMESHNGTFLNQRRLSPLKHYSLRHGDIVTLHRQIIQIHICYSD